jgi:hypothetical protein
MIVGKIGLMFFTAEIGVGLRDARNDIPNFSANQ